MRIQRRPEFRATAGVTFDSWAAGCEAVRHDRAGQAVAGQPAASSTRPRPRRAAGLDGTQALVIVSFESAELIAAAQHRRRRSTSPAPCGGHVDDDDVSVDDGGGAPTGRGGAVGAWRDAFIGVGLGVDTSLGLVADTFETAITWDRWPEFDAVVRERVSAALREVFGHEPMLSCRFTHVVPRRAGAVLHVVGHRAGRARRSRCGPR